MGGGEELETELPCSKYSILQISNHFDRVAERKEEKNIGEDLVNQVIVVFFPLSWLVPIFRVKFTFIRTESKYYYFGSSQIYINYMQYKVL